MTIKEFIKTIPIPVLLMASSFSIMHKQWLLHAFSISFLMVYCLCYGDIIKE